MPGGNIFHGTRTFSYNLSGPNNMPQTIAHGKSFKWEPNYTARVATQNKMHSASYLPVVATGYSRPGWVISQGVAYHPSLRPDQDQLPPIPCGAPMPMPGSPIGRLARAYERPRPNRVGFASSSLPNKLSPRFNAYTAAAYL